MPSRDSRDSRDILLLHLDISKACDLIPFAVEAVEDGLLTFDEACDLLAEQITIVVKGEGDEHAW